MKTGMKRIEEMREKGYCNNEISRSKYNLTIGLVLLWGFFVNAITCTMFTNTIAEIKPIVLVIGYFVSCIVGILICNHSDKPFVSFIGYNLIVIPVGAVLSIVVDSYGYVTVGNAFITTTIITLIMVLVSTLFPDKFKKLGFVLFLSLSLAIVVELILLLCGLVTLTVWDWIVAIIFCLYIGYDWAIAQEAPATYDNAVDNACGLYLDIINLFLRILKILGRKK